MYRIGEHHLLAVAPFRAGKPNFTLRLWPRAHHSLLLGVTGEPSEFRTLRGVRQLTPGYWDVLTHWLETRLTQSGSSSR